MTMPDFYPCCLADIEPGKTGCAKCGACEGCSPSPLGRVDDRCYLCAGDPPLEQVLARVQGWAEEAARDG